MTYNIKSLIEYGQRIPYGLVSKNDKEIFQLRKTNEGEEQDPASLKSYLDTILPPKESTESGQIFMEFVSNRPATTKDVVQLFKNLEIQMKARGSKETGICNVREELYSECYDELIRQVTINCLQTGELLNHVKEQMKETINYYQKLYESSMAFAIRKVLREHKKRRKLEQREQTLQMEIENLKKMLQEKDRELEQAVKKYNLFKFIKSDEEQEKMAVEDHEDLVKSLKYENNQKLEKLKEYLTTPKQITIPKMK